MKLHYHHDTDSLYISLADCPSASSDEVVPGIVLDFDGQGNLVGIDIEHASMTVDLSNVELNSFPFQCWGRNKALA